jgi:hypothetical protein
LPKSEGLTEFGVVAKGRGPKPSISEEKVAEIVELTLHSKPEGQTHWSCRSMAQQVGVSPASVQRIWSARGLKPHLVKTFKLSNDQRFEDKLVDVVGMRARRTLQPPAVCPDRFLAGGAPLTHAPVPSRAALGRQATLAVGWW